MLETSTFEQDVKVLEINSKRNILGYYADNFLIFYKLNTQNKFFVYKKEKNSILNFKFWSDGLLGFYTTNVGELKVINLKQKSLLKQIEVSDISV